MGKFSMMPVDVFPLVACMAAGGVFLAHSAYRTMFQCGEVHLYNRTRADELQENTDDATEKSKLYYKNSLYLQFGKMFKSPDGMNKECTWEPTFCKPEDRPV